MHNDSDIAVIGLGVRLPGALNPSEYWENLRDGVESIRIPDDADLLAAGVSEREWRRPGYVRATADLAEMAMFDAEFFGFSPKEAAIMDPQHRHFLSACWEALEDAAHVPESFDGAIGVFGGCGVNSYYFRNLLTNRSLVDDVGLFLLRHTGNDKDFLTTRVSYLLDLHGPSVGVQTACSTSLVAVHLAVQHLLSGECDLALAGGATIELPHGQGYHYEPGEILSPDGHCRAFDRKSQGTVFGSGAGVVALRRLADALADGDHVYAVIRGTAVNNDGAGKVGYLAPSVDGQAACVAEALGVAGVAPSEIGYVECHGTGTPVGDPIEIAALNQAFAGSPASTAVGSVKSNIGHLDTAAGVASLAKVCLALEHEAIPASLHFEQPNPEIDFAGGPFHVNAELARWQRDPERPRLAGVNSLGVGGTNAFAVVQEAPIVEPPVIGVAGANPPTTAFRTLTVSGRTPAALDANCRRLADWLADNDADLADVAWTLQVGRRHFGVRRTIVACDTDDAIAQLRAPQAGRTFSGSAPVRSGANPPSIAFLFPGGGSQHPRMAVGLYDAEPEFRRWVDHGLELLRTEHGLDLDPLLFATDDELGPASEALQQPSRQLPALFVVEHALARLLESWGIVPAGMLGHSVGENTAACIAGTMTFADCLGLVVLRGQLMDRTAGGMVSVHAGNEAIADLVAEFDLDIAATNAPELTVVSGAESRLAEFEQRLADIDISFERVKIRIAAHSRLLDPALDEFRGYLQGITLSTPNVAWVSNRTGTWITDEQATDPEYWVGQLRNTVRYSDGVDTLLCGPEPVVLLEVGPGRTLTSLARLCESFTASAAGVVPVMRHPDQHVDDHALVVAVPGRIWLAGGSFDTDRWFAGERRRRLSLPTYAFQTRRYFIEPGDSGGTSSATETERRRHADHNKWWWREAWRVDERVGTSGPGAGDELAGSTVLVLIDDLGVGARVASNLQRRGATPITVRTGSSYRRLGTNAFQIAPEQGQEGYTALLAELLRSGQIPDVVIHLWLLATDDAHRPGSSMLHRNQELGVHSLTALAHAWANEGFDRDVRFVVATSGVEFVVDDDRVGWPDQATVLGPASVMPREIPRCRVVTVDVDPASLARFDTSPESNIIVDTIERAAGRRFTDAASNLTRLAVRGRQSLARFVMPADLTPDATRQLHHGAVVLITGGLGGIGLAIAEQLVDTWRARLVLVSRTPLPPRPAWAEVASRLGETHPTTVRIRTIESIEEHGGEVMLADADVADVRAMRAVVDTAIARFGTIDAVVHAAGTLRNDLIASSRTVDVEDVLGPKLYGTLALVEVLTDASLLDRLTWFAVFSSTSTELAPAGQAAYVAANAFLDAFVRSQRAAGRAQFVSIGWGAWSEVGMAVASLTPRARPDERACTHPWLLASRTEQSQRIVRTRWSPGKVWMLDEHRTSSGQALLPGSAYPELLTAALAEVGEPGVFEIRELLFLAPLSIADNVEHEVEIDLTPTALGFDAVVRDRMSPSEPWRTTAEAALHFVTAPPARVVTLSAIAADCPVAAPTTTGQHRHLHLGPRWDVVRSVRHGDRTVLAELTLGVEGRDDIVDTDAHPGVRLHPALFDLATGLAIDLVDGYDGDRLWVPLGYHSISIHDRMPGDVRAIATVRPGSSQRSGFASFDVTITDPAGRVLVEIDGFTMKRLETDLPLAGGESPTDDGSDHDRHHLTTTSGDGPPLTPAGQLLNSQLADGITTLDGRLAFQAVVSAAQSNVFVSPVDLTVLRDEVAAVASSQLAGAQVGTDTARFDRPELAATYVGPRTEVEQVLVGIWQNLLGLNRVGVRDDFFELGGHSLVAVRLFAQVKRTFAVEFPISVLFDAPTIEACAALISAARPTANGAESNDSVAAPTRRFQYLVKLHDGDHPEATPIFTVAGMGGNVLNLRSLAQQVGLDRPFYGVQARGLVEGELPHETFEEAAGDYLVEVRAVQPHGPYLLAGYSGGGITALEMALQLQAAGEEVSLLTMLDTPLPWQDHLTRKEKGLIHLRELRRLGPRYLIDKLVLLRGARANRKKDAQPAQDAPELLTERAMSDAFVAALHRYHVRRYDGPVVLFRPVRYVHHVLGPDRSVDVTWRVIHDDNGWGRFCSNVSVHPMPGDHFTMVLEPNVRVLAGELRAAIASAERRR